MWWVFALPHFSSVLVLWWAFALPHSSSALVLWWVLAFPHSWTRKRPYGKTCWFKLSRVQKKTCWLKLSRVAPPAEWTVFFQWQSARTGWLKTQIKGDYNTIDFGVFLKEPGRTADPMLHIQQFATGLTHDFGLCQFPHKFGLQLQSSRMLEPEIQDLIWVCYTF